MKDVFTRGVLWALITAYAAGCLLAIVVGVALGDHVESKAPCLWGMSPVAADGQVWCMTDEKLLSLETGWCGAAGTFQKDRGVALIGRCVDRER